MFYLYNIRDMRSPVGSTGALNDTNIVVTRLDTVRRALLGR